MKKNIRTIGIVTAMWTLPITGYGVKYINSCMTLSELKDYLQNSLQEDTENIEKVRKQFGKSSIFPAKPKKTVMKDGSTLNGLYSEEAEKAAETNRLQEELSGITNVQFNENGEPICIKTLNVFSLSHKYEFANQNFLLWIKKKRHFEDTEKRLEALSEPLSDDKSADVEETKQYGISSVREITFASILNSELFTEAQRKKAEEWLKDNDQLDVAIDEYADNYPYIQKNVDCKHENTRIDVVSSQTPNYSEQTVSVTVSESAGIPKTLNSVELSYLISKKTSEASETVERIKTLLKEMLPFQNGKEKVILLLLLDENTPQKYRLRWINKKDCFGGYSSPHNAIIFDFNRGTECLSHEIGHYLQTHLGLYQTFDDYRTPFARELLQLENNQTEDLISIPEYFREDMEVCGNPILRQQTNNPFKCPGQLSAKKFFEYFQLMDRWHSLVEVSNILGIYFNGNTLYLNALSDIRELERIRYTHNNRQSEKSIENMKSTFKEEADKALLGKIVEEAYRYSVPTKMLSLLCRLHQREKPDEDAQNVTCDFNLASSEAEWDKKVKPLISKLLKAKP